MRGDSEEKRSKGGEEVALVEATSFNEKLTTVVGSSRTGQMLPRMPLVDDGVEKIIVYSHP